MGRRRGQVRERKGIGHPRIASIFSHLSPSDTIISYISSVLHDFISLIHKTSSAHSLYSTLNYRWARRPQIPRWTKRRLAGPTTARQRKSTNGLRTLLSR